MDALSADSRDTLHLLERINISLDVQKSIVPTALNLARFKIAGNLPSLHVNLSDSKYKALMRLIDVCIPNFDEGDSEAQPVSSPRNNLPTFQMPVGFFGPVKSDINIEDPDDDGQEENDDTKDDTFFEAEEDPQVVYLIISGLLTADSFHLATRLPPTTFPSQLQSGLTPGISFQSGSGF